jgi:hypothetical protein
VISVSARRLAMVAGWLLTPVVAWAASLLGGWAGASVVPPRVSGSGGLLWIAAGSLAGALAGVAAWLLLLRVLRRRLLETNAVDQV